MYIYIVYRFKKILVYLSKSYSLDQRALAFMRIALSLVIITDLIIRAGDLTAHYTNDGIWPTHLIKNFGWNDGFWSLHALSGGQYWIMSLFIIHFIFAFLLLIGYKTKLSNLIVWLLYISLHNRNLFIQQAGDDLLRLVLFWGLFLPWGNYYSVGSQKTKFIKKQNPLVNLGYLLLISSVYFFTICLKTSNEWRTDYTAIYYALSLEQLRLPFAGDWLYQFPGLMKALTIFVFYLELAIPILILWPAKKGYLRFISFLLLLILHIGIGSTLYVGLFFIINIVTGIGLLPAFVFDHLEKKFNFLKPEKGTLVSVIQKSNFIKIWSINSIALAVVLLSLIINLSSVKWFKYELRDEIRIPVNVFRLDQFWGMFSPSILKTDGWYVYYGMDSIGRQWDMIKNTDYVSFEKPESILKIHKTDRWRKLTENMQRGDMVFLRPLFCKYTLKKWNKEHPEKKLFTLKLYYMQKRTLADYKTTPVEKTLYCICNDN